MTEQDKILNNLHLYLSYKSWQKSETKYEGLYFYKNDDYEGLKIYLPDNLNRIDSTLYINNALRVISAINNENSDKTIVTLFNLNSDRHNYRLFGDDIHSIPLTVATGVLNITRQLIYQSTLKAYHILRKTYYDDKKGNLLYEISRKYLDTCSFQHTWQGSFGITIDAPLVPKDDDPSLFESAPPQRVISERIHEGFKIIKEAIKLKSADYVIQNQEKGFNYNMLTQVIELGESLKHKETEYSIDWSEMYPLSDNNRIEQKMVLEPKTYEMAEAAAIKLQPEDIIMQVKFSGFPYVFSCPIDDINLAMVSENRYFRVSGTILDKTATLQFNANYDQYVLAHQAHSEAKNLMIKCIIKKLTKGWEVLKLEDMYIID